MKTKANISEFKMRELNEINQYCNDLYIRHIERINDKVYLITNEVE